jgi:Xaa-Pro aminopeptidase
MTLSVSQTSECSARLARLGRSLRKSKLDAMVVAGRTNQYYLTGFPSTAGAVVATREGEAVLFVDGRYVEAARKTISCVTVRLAKRPLSDAAEWIRRAKFERVGFEGDLAFSDCETLKKTADQVSEWVECGNLVSELRAVKSRSEQALLRRVARLGDEVYLRTLEETRVGMTEWDVRRVLRGWVDRLDAEGESFDCIVSAGANASVPHAKVTDKLLKRGQPLLIDMGVRLGHYCSDMTRVVFLESEPNSRMRGIYEIVLAAHAKAIDAVRAGRTCHQVDAAARQYIERRGYRFSHGVGHGVGLDIHEAPVVRPNVETVLRPGMVITIEPGIYIPGVGGVRIEDTVIVRNDGCEILNKTPKALAILMS